MSIIYLASAKCKHKCRRLDVHHPPLCLPRFCNVMPALWTCPIHLEPLVGTLGVERMPTAQNHNILPWHLVLKTHTAWRDFVSFGHLSHCCMFRNLFFAASGRALIRLANDIKGHVH